MPALRNPPAFPGWPTEKVSRATAESVRSEWDRTFGGPKGRVGKHLVIEGKSIKDSAICSLRGCFLQARRQPQLRTFTANLFTFAIMMWTEFDKFYCHAFWCEDIWLLFLAKSDFFSWWYLLFNIRYFLWVHRKYRLPKCKVKRKGILCDFLEK